MEWIAEVQKSKYPHLSEDKVSNVVRYVNWTTFEEIVGYKEVNHN